MAGDIDISGLLKLEADLGKEPERVGRESAEAIRKSAGAVVRTARRNIKSRTGKLAASVGVDVYGNARSDRISAVAGPTEYYGPSVEFGHAAPGNRGGSKVVAPQPFMKPAFDAEAPKLQAALAEIIGRTLT